MNLINHENNNSVGNYIGENTIKKISKRKIGLAIFGRF